MGTVCVGRYLEPAKGNVSRPFACPPIIDLPIFEGGRRRFLEKCSEQHSLPSRVRFDAPLLWSYQREVGGGYEIRKDFRNSRIDTPRSEHPKHAKAGPPTVRLSLPGSSGRWVFGKIPKFDAPLLWSYQRQVGGCQKNPGRIPKFLHRRSRGGPGRLATKASPPTIRLSKTWSFWRHGILRNPKIFSLRHVRHSFASGPSGGSVWPTSQSAARWPRTRSLGASGVSAKPTGSARPFRSAM